MLGQPCLLVRSILKLWETMEWYVSFSNDIILDGVALLMGFLGNLTKLTFSGDAPPTFTNFPTEEVTMEEAAFIGGPPENLPVPQVLHEKWAKVEVPLNQFPGWEKVLHPSKLVTATGQASLVFSTLRQRHCHRCSGARRAQCQRAEDHLQVKWAEQGSTSPESLEPMQVFTLPQGFEEVMACLQRDPSLATTFEVPLELMQLEAMVEPALAMVCASHIVQDKASGITYMETVTTSVG